MVRNCFRKCKTLEIRKKNQLKEIDPQFFECLPELEELDLGYNDFDLAPEQFSALKKTQKILPFRRHVRF